MNGSAVARAGRRAVRIGVLALQGDFAEHVQALRKIDGVEAFEARTPEELSGIDGLVLPGGESTTMGKLMVAGGLLEPLRSLAGAGMPILATCAGAIMMARDIGGLRQPLIGVMDLVVRRNAFGRQLQSFETDLEVSGLGEAPVHAVFIRAPAIVSVGPEVTVLARLPDGTIVAARQGCMIATAFHPELTGDTRLHAAFAELVRSRAARP